MSFISGCAIFAAILNLLSVFFAIQNNTFSVLNVFNVVCIFWMISIAVNNWE